MAGDGDDRWQRLPISLSGECLDPREALDFLSRLRHLVLDRDHRQAVMAVMEIVVRGCLYPHLSPGVGIPLRKRFKNPSAMAAAAAAVSQTDEGRRKEEFCVNNEEGKMESGRREFDALGESVELLRQLAVDVKAGNLREIVLSQHLPDLWAGVFQLNHREGDEVVKVDALVEALPVAHAVEALMILLAKENSPPQWLEAMAGRVLSSLVIRPGGVLAVLERLVGHATQGDVAIQKRVAAHLAKCPKFMDDPEKYYSSVCSQLLEIIALPETISSDAGEAATRAVSNISHTAIAVVFAICRRKPKFVEEFVVDPLLEPVLGCESTVTREVIQSFLKLSSLITAGDSSVRGIILKKTVEVAPRLLYLHRLLQGDGKQKASGDRDRLRAAVGNLVCEHITRAPEHSLAICCSYIVEFSVEKCCWQWPDEGIDLSSEFCQSPGRYLCDLLVECENKDLGARLCEWAGTEISMNLDNEKYHINKEIVYHIRLVNFLD